MHQVYTVALCARWPNVRKTIARRPLIKYLQPATQTTATWKVMKKINVCTTYTHYTTKQNSEYAIWKKIAEATHKSRVLLNNELGEDIKADDATFYRWFIWD